MTRCVVGAAAAFAAGVALAQGPPPVVVPAEIAPLLADAGDRVVSRTFVPSPEQRVGEVRLIQRGPANVVQTLLYTPVLKRVVGEIRLKEERNWPVGVVGHNDATRYIEALVQAQERIWDEFPKFDRQADRRQKLVIEFVLTDTGSLVALGTYELRQADGEIQASARRWFSLLDLSRAYVQRNMRLIVADSFRVPEAEVGRIVGPLGLLAPSADRP
jgi:hypothetical protein